jgi:hypothetical protein
MDRQQRILFLQRARAVVLQKLADLEKIPRHDLWVLLRKGLNRVDVSIQFEQESVRPGQWIEAVRAVGLWHVVRMTLKRFINSVRDRL